MTPVDQTSFGSHRWPYFEPGDCLSACVATLLDLPARCVPHFLDERDPCDEIWAMRLDAWLSRLGVPVQHFILHPEGHGDLGAVAPPRPYVLCGTSILGCEHAVVARGEEIIFDPHPSRLGIERAHRMIVLGGPRW